MQGPYEDIEKAIRDYLENQARNFLRQKLHGREDYQPLEMEAGHVHNRTWLDRRTAMDSERSEVYKREWKPFDWKSLFDSEDIFILSSDVGSGKTTFLRYLQKTLLDRGGRIPIYLHAAEIEEWHLADQESLAYSLADILPPRIPRKKATDFFMRQTDGSVLLLIDGLDQMRGMGTAYEQLLGRLFMVAKRNVIVASRPSAVTSYEDDSRVVFLRLKPFNNEMQKKYFGSSFDRALLIGIWDQNMLGLPILASMVRTVVEYGRDDELSNRADLYRQFFDHVFQVYTHEGVPLSRDLRIEIRRAIQKISYDALGNGDIEPQKVPLDHCQQCILDLGLKIQIDDLPKCGLVSFATGRKSAGSEHLLFAHQSLQEYLAAEWASKHDKRINHIVTLYWNSRWEEVIKFLAGILGDSFVKRLYTGPNHDNVIRSRLFLAAECAGQTRITEETKAGLIQEITALTDKQPLTVAAISALFALGASEAPKIAWRAYLGQGRVPWSEEISVPYTLQDRLFSPERCAQLVQAVIDDRERDHYWPLHWWAGRISSRDITRLIETLPDRARTGRDGPVVGLVCSKGTVAGLTGRQIKKLLNMAGSQWPKVRSAAIRSLPCNTVRRQDVPVIMQLMKRDSEVRRRATCTLLAAPPRVLTRSQVTALTEMCLTEHKDNLRCMDEVVEHPNFVENLSRSEVDRALECLDKKASRGAALTMLTALDHMLTNSEIARIVDCIDYKRGSPRALYPAMMMGHRLDSGQIRKILDAVGNGDEYAILAMYATELFPHYVLRKDIEAMVARLDHGGRLAFTAANTCCHFADRLHEDEIWRVLQTLCRDLPESLASKSRYVHVDPLASVLDSEQNHFIVNKVADGHSKDASALLAAVNVETLKKEDLDLVIRLWQDGCDCSYQVYLKLLECQSMGLLV